MHDSTPVAIRSADAPVTDAPIPELPIEGPNAAATHEDEPVVIDVEAKQYAVPGSWLDLGRGLRQGRLLMSWWAAAFGYVLLDWFIVWGPTDYLFAGSALLAGAVMVLRNPQSTAGYLTVALGGVIALITERLFTHQSNLDALMLFAPLPLVVWAIVIGARKLLGHAVVVPRPAMPIQGTISDPIATLGKCLIVTGVLHLMLVAAVAASSAYIPSFFVSLVGVPEHLNVIPALPGWTMEAVEDVLLIIGGASLRMGVPWARAAMAALCGALAFDWMLWLTLPGPNHIVHFIFMAMWLYGFMALASRRFTHEFRVHDKAPASANPLNQLHAARRFMDDL